MIVLWCHTNLHFYFDSPIAFLIATDMKLTGTDPTPTSAKQLPNERDFHLDVKLTGLDVSVGDSGGDVVRANIAGKERYITSNHLYL